MRFTASVVATLALLSCPLALATPGDRDPSFSNDGIVHTGFEGTATTLRALALQPDGGIVLAGQENRGLGYSPTDSLSRRIGVIRLLPDGSRDPSFSGDGEVTIAIGELMGGHAVALQPDGGILLAGSAERRMLVARFLPDGGPDPSFGGDGIVEFDFGTIQAVASSIAVQPDGRIVVGGFVAAEGSGRDLALARLEPDGQLDPTFSGDGRARLDVGSTSDAGDDLALLPDGRILALNRDLSVVRVEPDGDPDPSFDGDGIATPNSPGIGSAGEIGVLADGRVLVGGTYFRTVPGHIPTFETGSLLARFAPDGSPDSSFAANGVLSGTTPPGIGGLSVAADGTALLASGIRGDAFTFDPLDFAAVRHERNGGLDQLFAGDGIASAKTSSATDVASEIAVQPDGDILLGGTVDPTGGISRAGATVVRLEGADDGPPDLDADGLLGPEDLCSLRFGLRPNDGCPVFARKITFEATQTPSGRIRFRGTVSSDDYFCELTGAVKVMRRRRGPDVLVGKGKSIGDADLETRDFGLAVRDRGGTYYAKLPAKLDRAYGECRAVRSRRERVVG